MRPHKDSTERRYETYEPYPATRHGESDEYGAPDGGPGHGRERVDTGQDAEQGLIDLLSDAGPSGWSLPEPLRLDHESRPRPLATLESLFADRIDLLQASLRELKTAEDDRIHLTGSALEDIDSGIADCDARLGVFRRDQALNDFERRKHLERQLLDLKRQRRQEAVLSWRDLLALRGEIRKLQLEVSSIAGTLPADPARKENG